MPKPTPAALAEALEPLLDEVFHGGLSLAQASVNECTVRLPSSHRIEFRLLDDAYLMVSLSHKATCSDYRLIAYDPAEEMVREVRKTLYCYRNTLVGSALDLLYRMGFAVSLHALGENTTLDEQFHAYIDEMDGEIRRFLGALLQSSPGLYGDTCLSGLHNACTFKRQAATDHPGTIPPSEVAEDLAAAIENFVSSVEVPDVDLIVGMSDAAAGYRGWVQSGKPRS